MRRKSDIVHARPGRAGGLVLLLLMLCPWAWCQQIVTADRPEDRQAAYLNIPSVAEFADRFNGDVSQWEQAGIAVDRLPLTDSLPTRAKALLLLFDGDIQQVVGDSALVCFATTLTRDSVFLHPGESAQEAVADMNFHYLQKTPVRIRLVFQTVTTDGVPAWQLRRAESDFFVYGDTARSARIPIPSAGIGFINLKDYLGGNPATLADFTSEPDNVQAFLFLTAKGLLAYHSTQSTQFFFSVGDYRFRVSYKEKETDPRSGFLIDKLWHKNQLLYNPEGAAGN